MNFIETPDAPKPGGHYSQAVVHGDLVFVAGQLPIDPATGKPVLGSVEEQTRLTLKNVEAILRAAGSSLDRTLRATVYVSDVSHWPKVNAVYGEVFGAHRPARTVVPTGPLHHGVAVEIDVIAAKS